MRKNKTDKIPVPREIKNRVSEKIENCISLFYNYTGFELAHPDVYYNIGGTTGGTAYYHSNVIELNPHLLLGDVDHFINRTVPHEVAHLLAHQYFGVICNYNVSSHGKYWKTVMNVIGVPAKEITRCHNYAINHKVKRQRRWAYTCDCNKIFAISTTLHNKMQKQLTIKGKTGRICRRCKCQLSFSGKEIT